MKLYNYDLYDEDGIVTTELDVPKKTLEELQAAVKGWIEIVDPVFVEGVISPGHFTVYINEESKLIGMEPNPAFPMKVWKLADGSTWKDRLYGPVLIERPVT